LEEVVSAGLSGSGGLCITNNYFLKMVLDFLGFSTFATAATWKTSDATSRPGTHCVLIVTLQDSHGESNNNYDARDGDGNENEIYLIDVGCGKPHWEPIPLHKLPFSRVTGGYPFEFRKTSDGIYERYQLKGSLFKGDFVSYNC
jgi:arylamine N-acetyltransferase